MWTKICANTNLEDTLLAVEMGASAVGFVLAPSKRQVTCEEVAEITRYLPPGTERVGVFTTDDADEIDSSVACGGLTAVQLHGRFHPQLVRELAEAMPEIKIIQTMTYKVDAVDRADSDARFEAALRLVFGEKRIWAVLLDATKSGASGGLGVSFDWVKVGEILERTREAFGPQAPHVILAGGLKAENLAEAMAKVKPWGVDVASGVESVPGKKDPARLLAFLEKAHQG